MEYPLKFVRERREGGREREEGWEVEGSKRRGGGVGGREQRGKDSGRKRASVIFKVLILTHSPCCYLPGKMISLFSKDPSLPISTGANCPELFPVKLHNPCTYNG